MTSLVMEALVAIGSLDREKIDERLEKMQEQVVDARDQFCRHMKDQYVEYLPGAIVDVEEVNGRIAGMHKAMQKEYATIKLQLEHVKTSLPTINKHTAEDRMQETLSSMEWLGGLVAIADAMKEIKLLSIPANTNFVRTASLLDQVEDKLKELNEVGNGELEGGLGDALRDEVVAGRERLIYDLFDWWANIVEWNTTDDYTSLAIGIPYADAHIQQNITALNLVGCLTQKLSLLTDSLLKNFVQPIFEFSPCSNDDACCLLVNSNDDKITIQLTTDKKIKTDWNFPSKALKLVVKLLDEIGQRFLTYSVDSNGETKTLALVFGENLGAKLVDSLLEKVLKRAVPCVSSEYEQFDKLMNETKGFEAQLRILQLIPDSVEPITQFAENTDTLFMKKRCQKILMDGRSLITADLHKVVSVGESVDPESTLHMDQLEEVLNKASQSPNFKSKQVPLQGSTLPPLFVFPKCKISQGIESLMSLVESTLTEASTCNCKDLATCLVDTSRDLIELFLCLTPVHHKHNIQTLPLIAGIFYNNCYYIAHGLLTLGWEVTPSIAPILGLAPSSPRISYVDFIPALRHLAGECMRTHISNAKNTMSTLLDETSGFAEISEPKNLVAYEKALKGCIMQMELIDRVWKEVLTRTVLMKAVGSLCCHLLKVVTDSVLELEDITCDNAAHMTDIITRFLPKLEQFFKDKENEPSQIHRFCESPYFRCNEVLLCVRGSLLEIDDRWAMGKGPLAQWLTSLEVRQIVRALFQTSERRAAVLANIK